MRRGREREPDGVSGTKRDGRVETRGLVASMAARQQHEQGRDRSQ
jgi:hypothetical protein